MDGYTVVEALTNGSEALPADFEALAGFKPLPNTPNRPGSGHAMKHSTSHPVIQKGEDARWSHVSHHGQSPSVSWPGDQPPLRDHLDPAQHGLERPKLLLLDLYHDAGPTGEAGNHH